MKKIIKRKSSSVPEQDEQDIAALINKMQEQLVSLEKKIDTLISRPSEKPAEEKHFSKPFQDRKSTRLNSSHSGESRMPSSA